MQSYFSLSHFPFDSRLSIQDYLNMLSSIPFGVFLITSKLSLFIPNSLFSVDLAYLFQIWCFSLEGWNWVVHLSFCILSCCFSATRLPLLVQLLAGTKWDYSRSFFSFAWKVYSHFPVHPTGSNGKLCLLLYPLVLTRFISTLIRSCMTGRPLVLPIYRSSREE